VGVHGLVHFKLGTHHTSLSQQYQRVADTIMELAGIEETNKAAGNHRRLVSLDAACRWLKSEGLHGVASTLETTMNGGGGRIHTLRNIRCGCRTKRHLRSHPYDMFVPAHVHSLNNHIRVPNPNWSNPDSREPQFLDTEVMLCWTCDLALPGIQLFHSHQETYHGGFVSL
jgi:hypothetical protein